MAHWLHPLTHVIAEAVSSPRHQQWGFPRIEWACPVPFFGRAERARIASVGLNPSDKEFLDGHSRPLREGEQRLATLCSLGLQDWNAAGQEECSDVAQACSGYFGLNAYWRWFRPLESILDDAGRGTFRDGGACHIDLAPWATHRPWGKLTDIEQDALVKCGEPVLKALFESTQFEVLLLNGASAVKGLQRVAGVELPFEFATDWDDRVGRGKRWSLRRDSLGRIELARPVTILGWNWNLQSSRIASTTRESIYAWAASRLSDVLPEHPATAPQR